MTTYSEKLKDPRWQKMRLQVLSRDNFECTVCGDKKSTLYVHHRYYLPKTEPWDYPIESFLTLCGDCHEREMVRPEYERELLFVLKKYFLAEDVIMLSMAIDKLMEKDSEGCNREVMDSITHQLHTKTVDKLIQEFEKSWDG